MGSGGIIIRVWSPTPPPLYTLPKSIPAGWYYLEYLWDGRVTRVPVGREGDEVAVLVLVVDVLLPLPQDPVAVREDVANAARRGREDVVVLETLRRGAYVEERTPSDRQGGVMEKMRQRFTLGNKLHVLSCPPSQVGFGSRGSEFTPLCQFVRITLVFLARYPRRAFVPRWQLQTLTPGPTAKSRILHSE